MTDYELLFYITLAWIVCAAVLLLGAYRDYQRILEERKNNNQLIFGGINDEYEQ